MEDEYNADVENIIQQAEKLQDPSIDTEDVKEPVNTVNIVSKLFDKMLGVISDDTRRIAVPYYKLWMLYVISWLGNIFLYVQLAAIISSKDSSTVSMAAYSVLLVASISWLIYGYLLKDFPLLLSGVFNIIGIILLLIFIPKYKKKADSKSVKSSNEKNKQN